MRYASVLLLAGLLLSANSALAAQVQCVDIVGTVVVSAVDDEHLPITNLGKTAHDTKGTVDRMNQGKACFSREKGPVFAFSDPQKMTIKGVKYIKYKTVVKWVPFDGDNIIVFLSGDLNGHTYGYCGPARNGFVAVENAKRCW